MAGTNSSFNASAFRAAMRSAMTMGTPPVAADALTFCWNPTNATTSVKDGEGVPFDPAAPVVRTPRTPVSKPCAVEYIDAAGNPTPFGAIVPSKVRVTLLDEDYTVVKDADFVVISGDRYLRHHEPPSVGLFSVGVHQIIYAAENES
jgi:hypothetical protein